PQIQINTPKEICIKAPPQKIVIEHSAPAAAPVAPQMAAMPQAPPMPVAPMTAAPQMMAMQAAPMASVPGNVTYQPTGRAMPAIGIDWVRIPVPFPRLFAI